MIFLRSFYKLLTYHNFKIRTNKGITSSSSRKKNFEPFYESMFKYSKNLAIVDNIGSFKYIDILNSSFLLAKKIQKLIPNSEQEGERVSFLCNNDATYVSTLLACWITGNVAVPLCNKHPQSLLEYYVEDSQSKLLIANQQYEATIRRIASKFHMPFFLVDHNIFSSFPQENNILNSELFNWGSNFEEKRALIIYTSGTTGRPKGVVLNHNTLHTQTSAVLKMWEITSEDSIFHSLPLHHIHGIMNALLCLLKAGGTVVLQQKFNAIEAWEHFLNLKDKARVNLFFAVPTMYAKLVQEFPKVSQSESSARKRCFENMRLFCSGSASLPVPVFERLRELTGHRLIERFGMSEIGMALSTTLKGAREAGTVGVPLPDVDVKIRKRTDNESTDVVYGNYNEVKVLSAKEGEAGELLVKGPNVFKEYWNREKATAEAFTSGGWFQTGDTVCYEKGAFRVLGRTSVDIIKSGGYKISALEVESCLLRHPDISECTVLGLPDDVWGERVAAVIKFNENRRVSNDDLKSFCEQHIPPYSIPTIIKVVNEIPRNVMGKVNKKELRAKYA